ncbi:class I SAM-dependent methyltransferase [Solilutibacter pythonis]|nr:class I SAM-dependent methyltransferase [Lysobacter pythonis]
MKNSLEFDTPAQADAWTRLWRRGVLHSCATAIAGNYDGAIARFWGDLFQSLNSGDQVIDLATGNGALALLAAQYGKQNGIALDIHGVDLADIDPVRDVITIDPLSMDIHFHPRTSISKLPFRDNSANLLCSQYGFEYNANESTAAELVRVLARDGCIGLILHSDDSVVAHTAPIQLDAIDYLLNSSLFDNIRAMAGLLAEHATPAARRALADNPAAERVRLAFNHTVHSLMDRLDQTPKAHVLTQSAQQIAYILHMAQHADHAGIDARIADWRDGLEAEYERLHDLQQALLSVERLNIIASWFRQRGLVVETTPITQAEGIRMGWSLTARYG